MCKISSPVAENSSVFNFRVFRLFYFSSSIQALCLLSVYYVLHATLSTSSDSKANKIDVLPWKSS